MTARQRRLERKLIQMQEEKQARVRMLQVEVMELPGEVVLSLSDLPNPMYMPRPRAYEGFGPLPKHDRQEMDELNSLIRCAIDLGDL